MRLTRHSKGKTRAQTRGGASGHLMSLPLSDLSTNVFAPASTFSILKRAFVHNVHRRN